MSTNQQTKRQAIVQKEIVVDEAGIAQRVVFAFPTIGKAFSVTMSQLDPLIFSYAAAHGIAQKIGDAAAISRNRETGRSASDLDKFNACWDVFQRLTVENQWNVEREGGTGSLLYKALCTLYDGKQTPEQIKAWLEGKSDDEKKALSLNKRVAEKIAEIRAANVNAEIDTDELLDELQ